MNKFSPGAECVCCGGVEVCTILADDYNRADNTSLGPDWDEQSAGAAITSNELVLSTANARVIGTTPNPDNDQTTITVSVWLSSSTATALIYLGYQDTSNCFYVQIKLDELRLVKVSSGVADERVIDLDGLTASTWYSATVCQKANLLSVDIDGLKASWVFSGAIAGNYHGLGCIQTTVKFDNFIARKVSGTCDACTNDYHTVPCVKCTSGVLASVIGIELSGWTNGTCLDCNDLNSVWLGENVFGCGGVNLRTGPQLCTGTGFPYAGSFVFGVGTSALTPPDATTGATINLFQGGVTLPAWMFTYEWGALADCESMNGLSLPLVYTDPSAYGGTCTPGTVTFLLPF